MKRNWYPPGSFVGPHWEVQVLHVVTKQWITYTEHCTSAQAEALADRYSMVADGKNVRVLEVQR